MIEIFRRFLKNLVVCCFKRYIFNVNMKILKVKEREKMYLEELLNENWYNFIKIN